MNKFYITEAIPYVNDKPHIGHALELIQTDVIARYHRILNEETFFLWGSDENAMKNVQSAEKAGVPIQEFIDGNAKLFEDLAKKLNIRLDTFQKTSRSNHHIASQRLWELCNTSGDIYKKSYTGLYCVGCEEFKNPSDLNENGECPEHPGKKLEEVAEENYFFKLSKYQSTLLELIKSGKFTIVPEQRKNEVISFIKSGLQDFSISRSNERAKNWGIPVPGDSTQRIYVWFDALIVYLSGVGFATDENVYKKWWPADVQVVGKGITRFHAIYWLAMLLSAQLALPKTLLVHEYITVNGQKMSKTVGNVIDPHALINTYGTDGLRYYCLAKISPFADSDFSEEKLADVYNADLANGLGNLIARVAKLAEKNDITLDEYSVIIDQTIIEKLNGFLFHEALAVIWEQIKETDKFINEKEPWKLHGEEVAAVLHSAIKNIQYIGYQLQPFLPETAERILAQFKGPKVTAQPPLFPRI
jgi:methionyl-tRNA synthetase